MSASQPNQQAKPIFAKPIPIIGVCGEFEAGKTRFLLSLAPGPETCIFDTEMSSTTYQEIGMRRVDVPGEMQKSHPAGYKPVDVYQWWIRSIRSMPAGKFRVIALDVAEDIETGLSDWVWDNPIFFNHTRQQYLKMAGVFWGDVKQLWKQVLLEIASRCETFAFSVHMGSVWGSDNKPTGAKRPKGKSTLMELATVFLQLERPTQADGSRQHVPSAIRLKSRLSHNEVRGGVLHTEEILPPRLPECTPEAIREYIAQPFGSRKRTKQAELAVPKKLTSDELAQMQLATAQANAEAARLQLEAAQIKSVDGVGGFGCGGVAQNKTSENGGDEHGQDGDVFQAESESACQHLRDFLPQGGESETTGGGQGGSAGQGQAFKGTQGVGDAKLSPTPSDGHGEAAAQRRVCPEDFQGGVKGDGERLTLQEAMAAAGPCPMESTLPTPDVIPPGLVALGVTNNRDAVQRAWQEMVTVNGWNADSAIAAWGVALRKYGAERGSDLSEANLIDLRDILLRNVRALCAEKGRVAPF